MNFEREIEAFTNNVNMTPQMVQACLKSLTMLREEARLSTFTEWPFDAKKPCNAHRMAEAGFVSTGTESEPDSAVCFLCHKNLDCWEENDDPWSEHLKHSEKCTFAKLGMPERELTLMQFMGIKNELVRSIARKTIEKLREDITQQFDEAISML